MRLEPLLVLERVVNLRVRHGTRLEPAVENVRDTAHHRLARRIIRIRANQLIDERTMQVVYLHAEVVLKFLKGTVDIFARVVRVIRTPDRDRRTPEAVTRDRPIASAGKPVSEDAVLGVLRNPGDLLVEFDHAITDSADAHEPRGHSLVDQRLTATPAVRVGVNIRLLLNQNGTLFFGNAGQRTSTIAQVNGDRLIRIEHLHALVVGNFRREATAFIHRDDR